MPIKYLHNKKVTMFFNLKKSGEGRRVAGPILVIRTSANGVKNLPRRHSKKKPMASRIRREEISKKKPSPEWLLRE